MPSYPMPIHRPQGSNFQGFRVNEAQEAGIEAGRPLAEAAISLKQMGIDEQKKQQAVEYQKLLRTGADGMRRYAQEVAAEHPELGAQIAHEAEQYSAFFQDPALSGESAEKYASHFYESANNRIKAIKEQKPVTPGEYKPATQEEAIEFYRQKKEIDADYRPPPKSGPGSAARAEKRAAALRQLAGVWGQIDELIPTVSLENSATTKDAEGNEVPVSGMGVALKPGTAQPLLEEEEGKDLKALRKQLNSLEAAAGLEATTSLFGPGRQNSKSYQLYAKGHGGQSGTDIAAPPSSQNSTDSALAWLKSPASKSHPKRAQVIAQLKKSGVDTGGL